MRKISLFLVVVTLMTILVLVPATAGAQDATLEVTPQATPEATPAATQEPAAPAVPFGLPDTSWLRTSDAFTCHNLTKQANVRIAPRANSTLVAVLDSATTPVVCVVGEDPASNRLLVMSEKLTGWVNNDDAGLDLTATVTVPPWVGQSFQFPEEKGRCQLIGEKPRMYYPTLEAPDGYQVTDLRFFPGTIIGKGAHDEEDDHVIVHLRDAQGKYNPIVTRWSFWVRREGASWSCDPKWLMMEKSFDFEKTDHPSIGLDLGVKDAADFLSVDFDPPFHFVDLAGAVRSMSRDDVLVLPLTKQILGIVPSDEISPPSDDCPKDITQVPMSSSRSGADVTVGEVGIPNTACWTLVIYLGLETPSDTIDVSAWQGARHNFHHVRDQAAFFYVPIGADAAVFAQWLTGNLSGVVNSLGITRSKVRFLGVPGFAEGETLDLVEITG